MIISLQCNHSEEQMSCNELALKAKRQLQQGQNFRGSTISEGSSNVGLLRGAAFGIQQEFMQFKNSLLEGKANISDAKQKRKRYRNTFCKGRNILKQC